ncbi:unnamed protein product, partial [Discosporangium mesarthrocarpum]
MIRLFHGNFLDVLDQVDGARSLVFLDPPWGGVGYKNQEDVDLFLSNVPLAEVCQKAASRGLRHVALKVPVNFNLDGFKRAVTGRVTVHQRNLRK